MSVCVCVCVYLSRNEQYYEAILTMWNQFYINIKSLISWQYCVQDITHINSLTLTMVTPTRRASANTV